MKILVVGSGGREHTLVWKLYQSEKVEKIYAAPGNDGMLELAEIVDLAADNIQGLADWAAEHNIDLTVVGPEKPLVAGIVDEFEKRDLRIFGPSREAARLEGSKVFSKQILDEYDIPTAEYEVFTELDRALNYLQQVGNYPHVIKAEGLAAGKGVEIVQNFEQASEAVNKIMGKKAFGEAGDRIVVEDFLEGREVSVLALTDGEQVLPLVPSQDHKPVFDGDEGPNTGGMGAYSPPPFVNQKLEEKIHRTILRPTIEALQDRGIKYKGILYAGLILTESGPRVLEFNVRFGDPEAQVVIPRLKSDLVEAMELTIDERLEEAELEWSAQSAACVMLASGGYPLTYETGFEIKGLEDLEQYDDLLVFHSGTRKEGDKFVTDGGRVLGLTVLGSSLLFTIDKVYQYLEEIEFEDMHYRTDIGFQAVNYLEGSGDVE